MVVEMIIGPTLSLLELVAAVPDIEVKGVDVCDVFVQGGDDTDDVGPFHGADELETGEVTVQVLRGIELMVPLGEVTVQVLRGIELAVPTGEPVSVLVTVMGMTDEPPVGSPVVIQMVDRLKEFVNDHDRLPALVLDLVDGTEV